MLKQVGAINDKQYNKLSIKCAFVCSLYIYKTLAYLTMYMKALSESIKLLDHIMTVAKSNNTSCTV
jgi:hypothetical protein